MHRDCPRIVIQFLKFSVVGITSFLIDYGLFLLLTYAFGVFYIAASTTSFIVSTVYNYVLSMRYVFQGKETQTAMQKFTIFWVLSFIGMGLNQLLLWACVSSLGISEWFGKLVATFLVMIYNFWSKKLFLEDHSRGRRSKS